MISVSPKHRIFLAVNPIDFRKGINGIANYCQQLFRLDPMSGHYFIFRNKRKTDIKLLYYDSQGFCLFHKRLSSGRFDNWPTRSSSLISLTPLQVQALIAGGNPENLEANTPWQSVLEDA